MPAYMAVLYRSGAPEGCGRDQPPATDNRRDQYAGNTVNRYEDAEAESMSEGVVRDLGKGTAEETSRVELTAGRQNLRNVRTEIQGGQRFSMISQLTGMIGIQVRTRTIRHVHESGWDAEKGSARENIEAA